MTTHTATLWMQRTGMLILIMFCATLLGIGVRCYLSEYYVVAATRGEKSTAEFENFLRTALALNQDNGFANNEQAKVRAQQRKFDEMLVYLNKSMTTLRPLAYYEQLGYAYDNMSVAAKEPEKIRYAQLSADAYKKVVLANPTDVSSFEALMLNAYRSGNDGELESLARKVRALDRDNKNEIYLRALAAERAQNFATARNLLQMISQDRDSSRRLFFKPEDVKRRLATMTETTSKPL